MDDREQSQQFIEGVRAYKHANGGGLVAETATVSPQAFVAPDARVYGCAVVDGTCEVHSSARVHGNAVLTRGAIVQDDAEVCGDAELSNVVVHGSVRITTTPIIITGFLHPIMISDCDVIIGCLSMPFQQWRERGKAFLRGNGFPTRSAERIHHAISEVIDCHVSLYHPDDLKRAYTGSVD
jgi:ribosomal protein S8E